MTTSLAVITGGTRGIGLATAKCLLERGYDTVLCYHRRDADAESALESLTRAFPNQRVRTFRVDVADPQAIREMFVYIDTEVGAVRTLVCCAGITRDMLLTGATDEDLRAPLEVNLLGSMYTAREAAKRMIAARDGSIVLISSVAGEKAGRGQSAYAASKGGVEAFTRALAVELGPRNIRVNAVAPGVIKTEMTRDIRALAPAEIERRILMRRVGTSEEVARVVAFLASDQATYVTGQVWAVDGGYKCE